MQILNLTQGTPEWHAERAKHHNASEAPVMMGVSPYATRNELLSASYNGSEKEISEFVQKYIFDKGHQVEAEVREAIEVELGTDLFPCMVVDDDGYLAASLDGITLKRDVIWEHKQFSASKSEHIRKHNTVPECDIYQVQQQLLVTGAERCLYTVGNDPDNLDRVWVEPDPAIFKQLEAGWNQFRWDLENYVPPETPPEVVGHTMESLPALRVEVTGMVTSSNLAKYKEHALSVFGSINTDLQTDQDFADAESTVKWCKDVEDRLGAAKQHALSQTESIDELFRTIDDLRESARQKRLELDKLVKARKAAIRDEIRASGEREYHSHLGDLEKRLEDIAKRPITLALPRPDFAGAMKGKRTISSLRDAVDQVLANAKIEANAAADEAQANLTAFSELAGDYSALFPDLDRLIFKAKEDFTAAVKLRIAEHKEAEAQREEERKAAEARRIAEAEERGRQQAESAARREAQAEPPPATPPAPPAPAPSAPSQETTTGRRSWLVTATFDVTAFEQMGASEVVAQFHSKATQLGLSPVLDSVKAEAVTVEEGKQEAA